MSDAIQSAHPRPVRDFTMNLLNGLAIGTVVALIPGALLGELVKALLPVAPWLTVVNQALQVSNAMIGLVIGLIVGLNFKFTSIQAASVGVATMYAGGAVQFAGKTLTLVGTGDIITMGVTASISVAIVKFLGDSLKAYTILAIPTLVLLLGGVVGRLLLPYIQQVTGSIGAGIEVLLTLQPILMAMLIAMVYSVLIVSPITTVGISLAIGISGIGSGAANIGICVAGFGLAVAGWRINSYGTSIVHFIGSAKISMANVLRKPTIMLPVLCSAALCGILAASFGIVGTKESAGFGFAGLVGPVTYLGMVGWEPINIAKALIAFVIAPVGFGLLFNRIFTRWVPIISEQDYYLEVK